MYCEAGQARRLHFKVQKLPKAFKFLSQINRSYSNSSSLKRHVLELMLVSAPIDFLFILSCFLSLPNVERYGDDLIFFDLFAVNFFRYYIEKRSQYSPRWNISRHHASMLARRNRTCGFKLPDKGVRLIPFCKCQSDLIVSRIGYDSSKNRAAIAIRIVVFGSGAVLSECNNRQQSHDRKQFPIRRTSSSYSMI